MKLDSSFVFYINRISLITGLDCFYFLYDNLINCFTFKQMCFLTGCVVQMIIYTKKEKNVWRDLSTPNIVVFGLDLV